MSDKHPLQRNEINYTLTRIELASRNMSAWISTILEHDFKDVDWKRIAKLSVEGADALLDALDTVPPPSTQVSETLLALRMHSGKMVGEVAMFYNIGVADYCSIENGRAVFKYVAGPGK